MKRVAFVLLLSLLLGMFQPAFAGMLRSDEPESYGGLSLMFRAVLEGTAGFFIGGIPGAVMGAGLMAFVWPGCFHDPYGPVVY